MAAEHTQKLNVTVEDLESFTAPDKSFELIEGELVELTPPGPWHNRIASNIALLFRLHCRAHKELDFGGDNDGFVVQRGPDSLLCPDASLFHRRDPSLKPWYAFAPEIAVEVLSPSNSTSEMTFKRHRFFEAGAQQFWLVDPDARLLDIFHADGRLIRYSESQEVVCEGLAEGLRFQLSQLFERQ